MVTMGEMTYAEAVCLALREAMREDARVWLLGEDISFGGGYGATSGLVDEFGDHRVRDTPIAEAAIAGAAVGGAMTGTRPVAEIMHMDFAACAMDQLVNQLAKMQYMLGGGFPMPATVRCGVGGWLTAGAQHSQSLEAWFTHTAGLKVATAATPRDIRAVLRAAILDDDPVMVFEPLYLYPTRGSVPDAAEEATIGRADVKRRGEDVTLITWGGAVPKALEAASTLAAEHGVSADVIDLLWLYPFDQTAIIDSVQRTHRAVIVHQAQERSGFGAEIAAFLASAGFDHLDAPVVRVAARNVPVPFAPQLEDYVLPSAPRIVHATMELLEA
jgi:acetoin:2,6-dichlorophenolindophenol oxidoreductase subunit beta